MLQKKFPKKEIFIPPVKYYQKRKLPFHLSKILEHKNAPQKITKKGNYQKRKLLKKEISFFGNFQKRKFWSHLSKYDQIRNLPFYLSKFEPQTYLLKNYQKKKFPFHLSKIFPKKEIMSLKTFPKKEILPSKSILKKKSFHQILS